MANVTELMYGFVELRSRKTKISYFGSSLHTQIFAL